VAAHALEQKISVFIAVNSMPKILMAEKNDCSSNDESCQSTPERTPNAAEPYTVWSLGHRRLLVLLLGYLGLASSLTANIYFPLLDLLAERYNVSVQSINLTITLYMVIQGIAPSFWTPLSDSFGRRPVYLATFTVYTIACLGLSVVDKNYPALLLLRGLQSIGGSAVLSLSYAVVADVTVHAERGRFLAPMLTAMNLGPCIGPVLGGGALQASGDPRWCFRTLLVFGASGLVLIGSSMPETGRSVVGNGAVPAKGLWRTWLSYLPRRARIVQPEQGRQVECAKPRIDSEINNGKTGRGTAMMPNPLLSLRVVFYADTFLSLWLAASPYALWFCAQASISPIFGSQYGFNPLFVGMCFLSGGAGIIIGGLVAGKLMDTNYKNVARAAGFTIDRVAGDDMSHFPIERARSRGSLLIIAASLSVVIGYGWAIKYHAHPAVLLLCLAFIACKCTVLHQTYSALIVDIFPDSPGTAAAANNITRCTLAAAAIAAIDPLARVMGYGWLFTLLGLIDAGSCVLAVLALRRWGRSWRQLRGHA
jgi:MFS family permease